MSEYKRLTWINEEGVALPINGTKYPLDDDTEKCLDRLAELEDKIESGEWVKLPKDKWVISRHKGKKTEYTYRVEYVEPYAEFVHGKWNIGQGYNPNREVIEEYDTKDQAEARLKELKGESV